MENNGCNSACGKLAPQVWTNIEAWRLEMAIEHFQDAKDENTRAIPCFDSSQLVRGFDVIACGDQFSRDFLGSWAAKISDAWEGVKLKVIPYDEVPSRPVAPIWLPKRVDKNRLARFP